jgi:hypothetical protein
MVQVSRVIAVIPYCLYVLFISGLECSACLPSVLQWAIHTSHLVYAILFFVLIYLQARLYWFCTLFCSDCNLYICFFIKSCDFFCFFSVVCKNGPFYCLLLWACVFVVCYFLNDFCLSFYYIYCYITCLV